MRTVKRNPFLSGVCAVLGGAFLWVGAVGADVTSDRAAGLLVLPKLIYDSTGRFNLRRLPTNTEIQLTNTSATQIQVRCFYVNANSHCSNTSFPDSEICFNTADCQRFGAGGICVPGWVETDFEFTMSPRQPIEWTIWEGIDDLNTLHASSTGSIPGVSEDPFFGELKCFQVDENGAPVDRNDLKAEVSIVSTESRIRMLPEVPAGTSGGLLPIALPGIDARAYNGIGVHAIEGANDGDNTLVLGGDDPEYNGCPSVLILDHFFDDAVEPIEGDIVKTHLTLVPCSQDFLTQSTFDTTVQFLVFNEFEQRFSASRKLNCWQEFELCHLDHFPTVRGIEDVNPASDSCQRSVFSAFVAGTLTGQTRIRGVESDDTEHGHGILGVAEEFYRTDPSLVTVRSSDAFNIDDVGERPKADLIQAPPP
jgi:hypothetical protein